jgi:uncharacterized protein
MSRTLIVCRMKYCIIRAAANQSFKLSLEFGYAINEIFCKSIAANTSILSNPKRIFSMFYFVRTQNPRPTFHLDMTPDERAVMEKHIAYCSEKAVHGSAIVFGPVMDPKGVYGIGVYNVNDEAEIREILKHDLANGLLQLEFFPMPRAIVGTIRP